MPDLSRYFRDGRPAHPGDQEVPFILKMAGKPKMQLVEGVAMTTKTQPTPYWQATHHSHKGSEAFLVGNWNLLASGKMGMANFKPVNPEKLAAALGLATVYKPDTAGWFVAGGRRLHVRTTDADRNYVTLSYESLARIGWATGVERSAQPNLSLAWDQGVEEPLPLLSFLKNTLNETRSAGAYLLLGIADCPYVEGQALRRSPAMGEMLRFSEKPEDDGRFFYRPHQEENIRILFVILAVPDANGLEDPDAQRVARSYLQEFMPPIGLREAPYSFWGHFGVFTDPLPEINPAFPIQAIWDVERRREGELLPRINQVRTLLENTAFQKGLVSVYAIDKIVPYTLYEKPDLVDVLEMDPTILTEQRWATPNTFVGEALYDKPRFLLRPDVAERIVRINQKLREQNFRLKLYDAYRPLSVTQKIYNIHPDRKYLAVPNVGSRHNRGAAVDCTITDMQGREVPMPSDYLVLGKEAHRNREDISPEATKWLDFLTETMASEGFTTINSEWWHYDAPNWRQYPVLDVPLWPNEEEQPEDDLEAVFPPYVPDSVEALREGSEVEDLWALPEMEETAMPEPNLKDAPLSEVREEGPRLSSTAQSQAPAPLPLSAEDLPSSLPETEASLSSGSLFDQLKPGESRDEPPRVPGFLGKPEKPVEPPEKKIIEAPGKLKALLSFLSEEKVNWLWRHRFACLLGFAVALCLLLFFKNR